MERNFYIEFEGFQVLCSAVFKHSRRKRICKIYKNLGTYLDNMIF